SFSCSDLVRSPTERVESHRRSETNTYNRTYFTPSSDLEVLTPSRAVSAARSPIATHQTLGSQSGDATLGVPARLATIPPRDAVGHGRARGRDLSGPAAAHPHNNQWC